ncbi:hypothetical protein FB451DRAFT_1389309 [Mycena latifolia]|nr:hypothetical protein FB451DRAFT_1389309 [Mycena latifolia]
MAIYTLTWTEYRLLSGDISDCAKSVREIRTAVQLIVEAERQRKYTEDINETEAILATTCLLIDTSLPTTGMLEFDERLADAIDVLGEKGAIAFAAHFPALSVTRKSFPTRGSARGGSS